MNKRRIEAEENYRQKFDALGLDFTFLRREWSQPHDKRFWVKCNKCGAEFLRYNDILRDNRGVSSVQCRNCGNGTQSYKPFVDAVMAFYSKKHSVKETAETFGIAEWQVNDWVKLRGVTNGRTISEINKEKAEKGAAKAIAEAGARFKQKMSEQGFDLVSDYQGGKAKVTLQCRECGEQFERTAHKLTPRCPACIKTEREQSRQKREAYELARKERAEAIRETKRAEIEAGQNKRFNELHICKVCGQEYTVKQYMDSCGLKFFSNPGYCSKTCRVNFNRKKEKAKNRKRSHGNHYHRAKKLGLPVEKGVTLPKLYKRDNGICQICGMVCVYSDDWLSDLYPSMDHIIPLGNDPLKQGGHTWKNVQLAHRICNSNKRDYVGKEWHNGND